MTKWIRYFASALMATCDVSCTTSTDRYTVEPGNGQGTYVIKSEPGPPAPVIAAPTTSPSVREQALQRRIDQLEAKQNSLHSDIERLRREKSATP